MRHDPKSKKKRATPARDRLEAYVWEQRRLELRIYKRALRDMMELWECRDDHGWTAADVKRIEEIRKLCQP
jgi:hypothetical protein